jgi:hypothetical protein
MANIEIETGFLVSVEFPYGHITIIFHSFQLNNLHTKTANFTTLTTILLPLKCASII